MSASSVAIQRAPLLGEHNRDMYVDMLGIAETELGDLEAAGAI